MHGVTEFYMILEEQGDADSVCDIITSVTIRNIIKVLDVLMTGY